MSRDPSTGVVVGELWSLDTGKSDVAKWAIHRVGAPAEIKRDRTTGIVVDETWYKDGLIHRDDGPAIIRRDAQSGEVKYTSWYREGVLIPRAQRPKNIATKYAAPTTGNALPD